MSAADRAAALWGGRVVRLLSHRENAVHEMALPDGTRAALRLHRPGYQASAAIRSELDWCAGLAAAGLPVPGPLAAADGQQLAELDRGQMASAVTWAAGAPIGQAGQPLPFPPARAAELHRDLGALLARIHAATDRLTLPAGFTRPRWDMAGLLGDSPLWGAFWTHPEATADTRARLIRARDLLRARLAGLPLTAPDFGLIHADVLRENIFLAPDGSLGLIDFDDSGWGYRLYDLGTVLSQNLYEPDFDGLCDALMAGYGTTDRAMVQAMTLMRCCASVGWAMTRLLPGDPVHPRHLARFDLAFQRFGAGG